MEKWNALLGKAGFTQAEAEGALVVVAVCALILTIRYCKRKRSGLFRLFMRTAGGMAFAFAANYLLQESGSSLFVGVGPVSLLTSAVLGIPGVCVLYGMLLI